MANKRTTNLTGRQQKRLKHFFFVILFVLLLGIISSVIFIASNLIESKGSKHTSTPITAKQDIKNEDSSKKNISTPKKENISNPKPDTHTEVLISSVGDCTIGSDSKFSGETLPVVLANKGMDYSYFFKNVATYFKNDDLTVANLETTFTNATNKMPKAFNFKAPPSYSKALTLGSIEAVNIANNHIYDYNKKGFDDTKETLKNEGVNFFGEGTIWKTTIKNKKFAFLGYRGWEENINFEKLKNEIVKLKNEGNIVIINFHWGMERQNYPIEFQKKLAKFSIDNGADLIIGHHPHVLQGIETYKGKYICYSLGNFCFGGNTNPKDKDTIILQTQFKFKNDKLIETGIKAIPCRISSVNYKNDYCPTPLKGDSGARILQRLNKISPRAGFNISEEFHFEKH
ncbi:CapA family protein [Hathewaya histolytica]|uniref:Encapsulation protein capA n=1 Tax=Hathewaya histolytica TaxID=1498 RepID=A0A4U9RN89_HATHI|nr:CapA family protein [Hathewaya histolytica]VTQ93479.1 encapsulation protein capA [Hathewaya histolytica]